MCVCVCNNVLFVLNVLCVLCFVLCAAIYTQSNIRIDSGLHSKTIRNGRKAFFDETVGTKCVSKEDIMMICIGWRSLKDVMEYKSKHMATK